jgi:site-specific recombinase XerD
MNPNENLLSLFEAFFSEYLISQMGASSHTMASYGNTFQLLLRYAAKCLKKSPSAIVLQDLKAKFVTKFLDDLEQNRKISARSRNVSLAAIHSFFKYLSNKLPRYGALIQEVLAIPEKRVNHNIIDFLTEKEVRALLDAPDQETWLGKRDHTLLVVAIHTGMRLSELLGLKWQNISLNQGANVECLGKGRKYRCIPLSHQATRCLCIWFNELCPLPAAPVFPTIHGLKMSADAFQYLIKKYTKEAVKQCPSLKLKKVTPHVLRHTAAMRMLQAGIDLASIALWLGHESIKTTYIYQGADIEMKKNILQKLPPLNTKISCFKPRDKTMAFLKQFTIIQKDEEIGPENTEKKKKKKL